MQPPYPPPTPIETSQQHYFGYEDTYQQQPNDYANDHLYYAQHGEPTCAHLHGSKSADRPAAFFLSDNLANFDQNADGLSCQSTIPHNPRL